MNDSKQIHVLGAFVHGVLASLHSLGFFYNLMRRNWTDTALHAGGVAYDAWAVTKHLKEVQR